MTPPAGTRKAEYGYDYLGRRVQKRVWTYAGGSWATPVVRRFVYQGWRIMLELEGGMGVPPVNTVLRRYTWGLDLAGQNQPVAAERRRFLAGLGAHAQQTIEGGTVASTVDLHGDLIRSTMLLTDESGTVASAVTMYAAFGEPVGGGTAASAVTMYTAFGEPVTWDAAEQVWRVGFPDRGGVSAATRYGYAGGWGYEGGPFGDDMGPAAPGSITLYGANLELPPVTLLHVGERWYEPGIARFIERDPIGLLGGLNVYAYVENECVARVDPAGQSSLYRPEAFVHLLEVELIQGGASSGGITLCVQGQRFIVVAIRYVNPDYSPAS